MAGTRGEGRADLLSMPAVPKRNAWTLHPWPPGLPDGVWAPLVSGAVILLAGSLGVLAGGRLWLFPSLGTTLYLMTEDAAQPSSRIYHVIVGHLIGIAAGYIAVFALGIAYEPSIFELGYLTLGRVGAAVIAMVLAEGGVLLADASHPPASATTLLVALGTFRPTVTSALDIVAGVIIVALAGELFRRLRLGGRLDTDAAK